MTLEAEVQSLRQVPMFRDIDPARLKLLAFTSERVQFSGGQRFFSQGDPSDAAYVILEGRASVLLGTPGGEIKMAIGNGQQAIQGTAIGRTKYDAASKRVIATDIQTYPAECVMPPERVKSMDWIKNGMASAKC